MPLDIHRKGKKVREVGREKYAGDPNATGSVGSGNFTTAQNTYLAEHSKRAMLRYAIAQAYFCSACWYVFGVECPKCGARSEPAHYRPTTITKDDVLFEVPHYPEYDWKDGVAWVVTTCRKCSFSFRVIKR